MSSQPHTSRCVPWIALALVGGGAFAQQPAEDPFAKPFRFAAPGKDVPMQEIDAVLGDLETLRQHWQAAKGRGHDDDGRPDCELDYFRTLRDQIRPKLERKGGHLRTIIQDDRSTARRRSAYFGAFFLPDTQDGLHLMYFLPHEPSAEVRREMCGHAAAFVSAQLPRSGGDAASGGYQYQFNVMPWIDLTRAPSAADRALGFDLLARVARARPDFATAVLAPVRRWLPDCLRAESVELRRAVADFVSAVDPQAQLPAEPEAAVAELARVLDRLFPAIHVQGGMCDLRPGPDRDRLVEVGRDALRRGTMARRASREVGGRAGNKTIYGLRLDNLPEPLDKLGLVEGDVITALDGTPLESCEQLLQMIETALAAGRTSFALEWYDKRGSACARRYYVRS